MSVPADIIDQALAAQAASGEPAATQGDPIDQALATRATGQMFSPTGTPLKAPDPYISRQTDQPIQGGTPVGMLVGRANEWMGNKLASGAQWLGVSDPNSLRDIRNLPAAAETVLPFVFGSHLGANDDQATSSVDNPQSISAARATPNLTTASPELQTAVRAATQETGGAVNPDALVRHVEADSLPVPVQLTRGQATQDPSVLSFEQNRRGALPELGTRFNAQNGQLIQNLQALRDQVGPDVFSANPVEHGDTLIKAYQDKAAAADAQTTAAYKAFADSSGGTIDQSGFLPRLAATLKQQKVWNQDGTQSVVKSLSDIADNPNMTADDLEAYQTSLARTIRSTQDGHEAYAAGLAKQYLYDIPPTDAATAQQVQLGMAARQTAKAQFDAIKADPAYDAAVNGNVPPDQFVRRFVTGPSATRDGVATMKANLADNPVATQTMGVATLDHLRQVSGIDDMGNGNFSQANFNKNLQALGPRLPALVDPKTADTLQTLGNVARYTQAQPRGAFVNNSNTATSAAAEFGKNALEGAVNMKFGGIPVGTVARKYLQGRAAKAFARDSLAPGAGLTDLTGNP